MPEHVKNPAISYTRLLDACLDMKKRDEVPGLAVGIWAAGKSYVLYDGVTNVDNPLTVNEDTLFQIGSITKTFTGLAIMILVSRGLVDLDTPICHVLTDFKMTDGQVTREATIRHLLIHTGGWQGNSFEYPDLGEESLLAFVKIIGRLPQISPLGKIWAYNSTGFCIAGRIIEVLTGRPYEQAIAEMILRPLEMGNSVFTAGEAIVRRFAVGHERTRTGSIVPTAPWEIPRALNPSGGLACSLNNVMKYARFMMEPGRPGCPACRPELMQGMFARQFDASGKADAAGLSWMLRYAGDVCIVRHGGATLGQFAELLMIPAQKFALAILTNGSNGENLIRDITDRCLKECFSISPKTYAAIAIDESSLSAFAGLYVGFANDIEISHEKGMLMVQYHFKPVMKNQTVVPEPPPPMRAYFYAENRAITEQNGVLCDFFRDEQGVLRFLRHGNEVHVKR